MQILDGRSQFYQWDLNQRLTAEGLTEGDEVHFSNATMREALVVKAYEQDGVVVADVPNILLQAPYPVEAFRYIKQGPSEHTIEVRTFSVQKRPRPSDYIYTETAVNSYEQLAAEMIKALATIDTFNAEKDEMLRKLNDVDAKQDEAFDALSGADEAIRRELAEHEETAARQNAANREAFDAIGSEVEALGEEVKDLDASVKHMDTDVQNLDTAVANLDTKVTNLDTKVTNLDTQVANLDTAVANFGTVVTDNNNKVVNLEAEVEDAKKALGEAATALGEADEAIRQELSSKDFALKSLRESDEAIRQELGEKADATATEEALAGKSAVKVGGEVVQDFDADTKLDLSPPTMSAVYGTNGSNKTQQMFPLSTGATRYSVAYRGENAALGVGRATEDTHAVPLAQMREALAGKANGETTHEWLDILTKKVTNLEAGLAPDMFIVDDATAYVKDIPTDAAPYAELLAVGGMTHKVPVLSDENLFVSDALNNEWGGMLFLADGDAVSVFFDSFFHSNMCNTEQPFSTFFPNAQAGKTYLFSYKSNHAQERISFGGVTAGEPFTMTEEILNGWIDFIGQPGYEENGEYKHVDGCFYDISLVEVTEELLDTPVTALDITGKNLFDEKAITGAVDGAGTVRDVVTVRDGYVSPRYGSYGNSLYLTPFLFYVKEGQRVNVSADVFIPTGGAPSLGVAFGIGNPLLGFKNSALYPKMSAYDKWERASKTLTAKQTGYYFLLLQGDGDASNYDKLDVRFKNIKVTTDTADTTYSPYHKTAFAIPAAVQALDGYGWGVDGAVNGIEWNEGGAAFYVKRVERRVYDGTEDWRGDTASVYYLACNETFTGAREGAKGVSNKMAWRTPSPCIYTSNSAHRKMSVIPAQYASTEAEWKAQLAAWAAEGNPLTVYYELAEPIVTNITRHFYRDNLIEVEAGGTITAVNEHNLAAPSTIVYRKRGF